MDAGRWLISWVHISVYIGIRWQNLSKVEIKEMAPLDCIRKDSDNLHTPR